MTGTTTVQMPPTNVIARLEVILSFYFIVALNVLALNCNVQLLMCVEIDAASRHAAASCKILLIATLNPRRFEKQSCSDYKALWPNCRTKRNERNTVSRFHLVAHYEEAE